MSAKGPGCVKTQTLNLRVEFPSRFRRCGNQSHWQMLLAVGNRENNSEHPRLRRVFTQPRSKAENLNSSICFPLFTQQRTFLRTAALRPEAVVPPRTLGYWPSPTAARRALMSYAEFQILDVF